VKKAAPMCRRRGEKVRRKERRAHLGDDKAFGAHDLEGDLIGDHRRVAVGNVGKWTTVHENRGALHRLFLSKKNGVGVAWGAGVKKKKNRQK
jgi:hypothetical protein